MYIYIYICLTYQDVFKKPAAAASQLRGRNARIAYGVSHASLKSSAV